MGRILQRHYASIDPIIRYNITVIEYLAEPLCAYYKEKYTGAFGKFGVSYLIETSLSRFLVLAWLFLIMKRNKKKLGSGLLKNDYSVVREFPKFVTLVIVQEMVHIYL